MAQSIEIVDVTARDGLQNEATLLHVDAKVALINRLISCGVKRLEVASFVNPKRVPQMADAEAVLERLPKREDLVFIGLVLNERGLDRALETAVDEVGCVCVSTDTFATKNQGQTSKESVDVALRLIRRVQRDGRSANVTIATAFGCPFEGEVGHKHVIDMAKRLADACPREIALADTIGVADPWRVEELFGQVSEAIPGMPLRAHFHDTRNTGLANIHAAIRSGVRIVDGSLGGIGGCPFAPAATGNVPTEDVVYMLERAHYKTGLDLMALIQATKWLGDELVRPLPGMLHRAGPFPKPMEVAAAVPGQEAPRAGGNEVR